MRCRVRIEATVLTSILKQLAQCAEIMACKVRARRMRGSLGGESGRLQLHRLAGSAT